MTIQLVAYHMSDHVLCRSNGCGHLALCLIDESRGNILGDWGAGTWSWEVGGGGGSWDGGGWTEGTQCWAGTDRAAAGQDGKENKK